MHVGHTNGSFGFFHQQSKQVLHSFPMACAQGHFSFFFFSIVPGKQVLGCGFKYVLFLPLPGEMIQSDLYFSNGLKLPTRSCFCVNFHEPYQPQLPKQMVLSHVFQVVCSYVFFF